MTSLGIQLKNSKLLNSIEEPTISTLLANQQNYIPADIYIHLRMQNTKFQSGNQPTINDIQNLMIGNKTEGLFKQLNQMYEIHFCLFESEKRKNYNYESEVLNVYDSVNSFGPSLILGQEFSVHPVYHSVFRDVFPSLPFEYLPTNMELIDYINLAHAMHSTSVNVSKRIYQPNMAIMRGGGFNENDVLFCKLKIHNSPNDLLKFCMRQIYVYYKHFKNKQSIPINEEVASMYKLILKIRERKDNNKYMNTIINNLAGQQGTHIVKQQQNLNIELKAETFAPTMIELSKLYQEIIEYLNNKVINDNPIDDIKNIIYSLQPTFNDI